MQLRSDERVPVSFDCTAGFPAVRGAVRILDLSTTGCRMQTDCEFAKVGATVILDFTGDRGAAGQILWARGGLCGVRFYDAIAAEDIDFIAAASHV